MVTMIGFEVPTPSPIPSPSDSPYSLSEQINIATRPIHSLLNRSIIARLPLALPPHAINPSIYVSGILHIAPIYLKFESLWQYILDTPHLPACSSEGHPATSCRRRAEPCLDACDPDFPLLDSRSLPLVSNLESPTLIHCAKVCTRTHSILSHLRLPGLLRGGRLLADIRTLTGTSEHEIEAQIKEVSSNGRLAAFLAHTKQSVEINPHVLLAYAWVLYMAMFSGGRYVRASLQTARRSDGNFWRREPIPDRQYTKKSISEHRRSVSKSEMIELQPSARTRSRSEIQPEALLDSGNNPFCFQFFNFLGEEDGQDIKCEFKKRMMEAEMLLTPGEKEDIVTEALQIFEFMVEMVAELDTVCGTKMDGIPLAAREGAHEDHRPLIASRDSVHITQLRLLKKKEDSRRLSAAQDSSQVTQDWDFKKNEDSEDREDKEEEVKSNLEDFLANPSPKLVHFKDSPWNAQQDFLARIVLMITRPLGRPFSREGFAYRKSGVVVSLEWATIFVTTITTSILIVVLLAWYLDYGLALHC